MPRGRPSIPVAALVGILLLGGCGGGPARHGADSQAAAASAGVPGSGTTLTAGFAPARQDPHLTPGSTVAGADTGRVCAAGSPAAAADVPERVRAGVFATYGIAYPAQADSYRIDHLVPVELGGDDTPRNLWPEADENGAGFPSKARLGDRLHELVCAGSLPLVTAQQALTRDWYAAALQYGVAVVATATPAPGATPPLAPVQVAVEPEPVTPTPTATATRSRLVVRLGAPCSTPGTHAQTATGTAVTCRRIPGDPAYRWHTG